MTKARGQWAGSVASGEKGLRMEQFSCYLLVFLSAQVTFSLVLEKSQE